MVISAADYAASCVPVARHGLQENGVRCPRCGTLAVEPGDWRQVHKIERHRSGVTEEAVCCWQCNAFLLASPDDAIDPVAPGDNYDPNIYHRFERPEGWQPPRQRVLERSPLPKDWVVVWDSFEAGERDLYNAEGQVLSVEDGIAVVQLSGFCGLASGDRKIPIPIGHLRVMVFDTYRIGMRVTVTKGPHLGRIGEIVDFKGANLTVSDSRGTFTTIQEHVITHPE